jgi:hypothetical protein
MWARAKAENLVLISSICTVPSLRIKLVSIGKYLRITMCYVVAVENAIPFGYVIVAQF